MPGHLFSFCIFIFSLVSYIFPFESPALTIQSLHLTVWTFFHLISSLVTPQVRSPISVTGKTVPGVSSVLMSFDVTCEHTPNIGHTGVISVADSSWDLTISNNTERLISDFQIPQGSQPTMDRWMVLLVLVFRSVSSSFLASLPRFCWPLDQFISLASRGLGEDGLRGKGWVSNELWTPLGSPQNSQALYWMAFPPWGHLIVPVSQMGRWCSRHKFIKKLPISCHSPAWNPLVTFCLKNPIF